MSSAVVRSARDDERGLRRRRDTGEVDQPWGHGAKWEAGQRNGPAVDNPPVLGPAGRVHCKLEDWAKFVADQLRGAAGIRPCSSRRPTASSTRRPSAGTTPWAGPSRT